MADAQVDFVDFLEGVAGIVAVVGDRIYPDVLPQGVTYPAGRVQRIDTLREPAHDGPTTLARPRFQVDWYSPLKSEVLEVAKAARLAVNGFVGTMVGTSVGVALLADESDEFEPGAADTEPGLYRIRQDYFIHHQEAIA